MLRKLILGILLNTLSFYVVTLVVPEVTYEGGLAFLITTGIFLGFLNAFVKPVLKVFSLPLVFLSMGLFLIVINAVLLWFVDNLYEILAIEGFGITMEGFTTYLIAGAVFGVVNWFEHWLVKR